MKFELEFKYIITEYRTVTVEANNEDEAIAKWEDNPDNFGLGVLLDIEREYQVETIFEHHEEDI